MEMAKVFQKRKNLENVYSVSVNEPTDIGSSKGREDVLKLHLHSPTSHTEAIIKKGGLSVTELSVILKQVLENPNKLQELDVTEKTAKDYDLIDQDEDWSGPGKKRIEDKIRKINSVITLLIGKYGSDPLTEPVKFAGVSVPFTVVDANRLTL